MVEKAHQSTQIADNLVERFETRRTLGVVLALLAVGDQEQPTDDAGDRVIEFGDKKVVDGRALMRRAPAPR